MDVIVIVYFALDFKRVKRRRKIKTHKPKPSPQPVSCFTELLQILMENKLTAKLWTAYQITALTLNNNGYSALNKAQHTFQQS